MYQRAAVGIRRRDSVVSRPRVSGGKPGWRELLMLCALTGFAIAQPLLDLFGRSPEAFIVSSAQGPDVVYFAFVVAFLPPLLLWLVVLILGSINPKAGSFACCGFLALLAFCWVLVALNRAGNLPTAVSVLFALATGALLILAYARWNWFRYWLMFAAITPVLVLGLFLFSSSSSELIANSNGKAADVEISSDAPPVVLIIFDEMPMSSMIDSSGEIDKQLYPNLSALAADGGWYRNATTVSNATQFAAPAILSGRFPSNDRSIPIARQHPESLFTLLASRYDIEANESVTKLCPDSLCNGPFVDDADGLKRQSEPETQSTTETQFALIRDARLAYAEMLKPGEALKTSAEPAGKTRNTGTHGSTTSTRLFYHAVNEAKTDPTVSGVVGGLMSNPELHLSDADKLVESIEPGEGPTLHYLHMNLPHQPYRLLPTGELYEIAPIGFDPELSHLASAVRGPTQQAADADRHRLILQVGAVDSVLGRVIARLKETGLYERSVIVVTSDHGVGMTADAPIRGLTGIGPMPGKVYADILPIPLIIKGPGIAPGLVSDENVYSIDVLPTIADMVGADIPWKVDGRSVLSNPRGSATKEFRDIVLDTNGVAILGPFIRYDGERVLSQALQRNVDTLLRRDNPKYPFYNANDAGELIGRPLKQVAVGASVPLSFTVKDRDAFLDVDPKVMLPAHVHGELTSIMAPTTLAFVLNGVVAGVTTTYVEDGHATFDTILIPNAFKTGRNNLKVFMVRGREGARFLRPIAA